MPRLAPREVIFIAMVLAIFMVSVEATIVATAMPTIVADLGGLRYFSWVFGAYLLTQAVCIPIYGRLADFFGRKRLLTIAIVVFLTGSILSGFARSMLQLILFRALQGIGGGGVQPVATTIVGDLYSGRERARVQAILSSTWAFAAVIGPLLGAFLIGHIGWQSIFWINVPVGIACVVIMLRAFHETIARVAHKIDYVGSLLLASGVGTLMFVLVMLGNIAPATAISLGITALALLAVLLWHELRTPEPMMPLSLYKIRMIAIANAGNFAIGAMLMGISAFLPTFVQGAMNQSPVVAGAVLGSIFIGWTAGSIGGARIMLRTSYRFTALSGAVPMIAGSLFLATLGANSNIAQAFAGVTLMGLGIRPRQQYVRHLHASRGRLGTARLGDVVEHLLTPDRSIDRIGGLRRGVQRRHLFAHPRRRRRPRTRDGSAHSRNAGAVRSRARFERDRALAAWCLRHPHRLDVHRSRDHARTPAKHAPRTRHPRGSPTLTPSNVEGQPPSVMIATTADADRLLA